LKIPQGLFEANENLSKEISSIFVYVAINEFKKPEVCKFAL